MVKNQGTQYTSVSNREQDQASGSLILPNEINRKKTDAELDKEFAEAEARDRAAVEPVIHPDKVEHDPNKNKDGTFKFNSLNLAGYAGEPIANEENEKIKVESEKNAPDKAVRNEYTSTQVFPSGQEGVSKPDISEDRNRDPHTASIQSQQEYGIKNIITERWQDAIKDTIAHFPHVRLVSLPNEHYDNENVFDYLLARYKDSAGK